MTTSYKVSPRALEDLDAIADYTLGEWGRDQAVNYIQSLYDRFDWLADNPKLGPVRRDIRHGLRSYPEGAHVIYYRQAPDGIQIVGVLHGAQDIETYFGG